jgi:hypothetical protein
MDMTWKTVPQTLTPTMRKAAAAAARDYFAETGGNSIDVIWTAALASAPRPVVRHELEVIVTDRNNTYWAQSAVGVSAEQAGLQGKVASCTAGSSQAVRALLEKSEWPLDVKAAEIVAMLPDADDRHGVSRFNVVVWERGE